MRGWSIGVLAAVLGACRGSAPVTPQQLSVGVGFPVAVAAVFDVCWPPEAPRDARVRLEFTPDDVTFSTFDGAENATGRCLRELASAFPFTARPSAPVDVRPPKGPIDGWGVLGWAKLLAAERFAPLRGLVDPLPAAVSCVGLGAPRPELTFTVRREPALKIELSAPVERPSEACLEAVLGAMAWPSSRVLTFSFRQAPPAVSADRTAVLFTAVPDQASALDGAVIRRAFGARREEVQQCWEEVMARRPTAAGARTVRWTATSSGLVAWIVPEAGAIADVLLDACLVRVTQSAPFDSSGPGEFSWSFGPR